MKAFFVLSALLAAVSSAIAVAVPAEAEVEPVYNWRVIDSGFGTDPPPFANTTDVSLETLAKLEKRQNGQVYSCYNRGRAVQRGALTSSIDNFCNTRAIGKTLTSGQNLWVRYLDDFSGITVLVFMEMTNGCSWTIDSACNNNFRVPVDKCNTEGVSNKQGGEMWDLCAHYRIDPGDRNSNDY